MSNATSSLLVLDRIPIDAIEVSDRLRADLGDLTQFDSIREVGLVQPIILHLEPDGSIKLIAGGRRLAALKGLGYTEVHHGVTSDPQRPGFVYVQELSEDVLLELEITENVSRKSMTWQETCLGIARIHETRERQATQARASWVQEQTGKLLGVSRASINNAIIVAKALRAQDHEIVTASTMSDAIKTLFRRAQIELEKRREMFRLAAVKQRQEERLQVQRIAAAADLAGPGPTEATSSDDVTSATPREAFSDSRAARAVVAFEQACEIVTCCDSLKEGLINLAGESVDHVYTDIPYGIEMDNLNIKDIDTTAYAHDRTSNIEDFAKFLQLSYRVIKPGGFCVFWFDIEHFTTLLDIARRVGFSCQRWPLHWHKSLAKNETPRYNTTKNYESVMFCRKQGAVLNAPVSSSIFAAGWGKNEREKFVHPFAKPFAAHELLLKIFTSPGQTICDPYCGEGTGVLACLQKGLTVKAFDFDETHVRRAREHIVELLCTH